MGSGRRRFTAEERTKVAKLIRKFLGTFSEPKKVKRPTIAKHLNEIGVPHPNGAWTGVKVKGFLTSTPLRVYRKRGGAVSPCKAPVSVVPTVRSDNDRLVMAEIVLASNLGHMDKERVLRSLFSDAR